MEQLAKAGGVTKPILYRHFGDRDGLIQAIAERFSTDLLTSVTTPLTADCRRPRPAALHRRLLRGLHRARPEPLPVHDAAAARAHRGLASMGSLIDLIARQVAQVAGERLRAAGRDSGAAVPWAYGIIGLVHQAGDWWVDDQTMSRETLVSYLVSLLWDGLNAAQGAAAVEA